MRPQLAFARVSLARVWRDAEALAERFLSPTERHEASSLTVPKRRIERMAGRMAARRALHRLGLGALLPAVDIVACVEGPSRGAPTVCWRGGGALPLALSISHGAGSACAVASTSGGLGLDVERVEAREPAFVDEAFAPGAVEVVAEALGVELLGAQAVSAAWCLKEACMKLSGHGLRAPLRAYAPLALEWSEGTPEATRLGLPALRRARLRTQELGWIEARLLVRHDLAAALVTAPRGGPSEDRLGAP